MLLGPRPDNMLSLKDTTMLNNFIRWAQDMLSS